MNPPERYTVLERLAIGTAGIVYRAEHQATGREVLFKVLLPESSHPLDPAKVLALAGKLQQLHHASITPLLDVYEDPEGCVLVSEYVVGSAGNLYATQRQLSLPEARQVTLSLLGALSEGERLGLPHGDLKPSNLVLTEDGETGLSVQVQDWGLSECRREQPPETIQFMAPERLAGGSPTAQSDLHSLAATLYFLLTGSIPVPPNQWSAYLIHELPELRPDLDEPFRQWLAWLLQTDPQDRPATAQEAADSLTSIVSATPISKLLPTVPAPAAILEESASRPSGVARLMAATFYLCLLGGIGLLLLWWAEEHWGPDWKNEIQESWLLIVERPPMAPMASTTPTDTVAPKPSVTPPSMDSTSRGNLAEDLFHYPAESSLHKASGGRGWSAPWEATGVKMAPEVATSNPPVWLTGKATMQRLLAPSAKLTKKSLTVLIEFSHSGEPGSSAEFDLVTEGASAFGIPVILQGHGKTLSIQVQGSEEVIECPAHRKALLALKWSFKSKKGADHEVELQAYLNPEAGSKNPIAHSPSSRRVVRLPQFPARLGFRVQTVAEPNVVLSLGILRVAPTILGTLR